MRSGTGLLRCPFNLGDSLECPLQHRTRRSFHCSVSPARFRCAIRAVCRALRFVTWDSGAGRCGSGGSVVVVGVVGVVVVGVESSSVNCG